MNATDQHNVFAQKAQTILSVCMRFSSINLCMGGWKERIGKRVRNTKWTHSPEACLAISNSEVNLDKTRGMQFLRFQGRHVNTQDARARGRGLHIKITECSSYLLGVKKVVLVSL